MRTGVRGFSWLLYTDKMGTLGAYYRYFNDALSAGVFRDNKAHLIRALYNGDGYLPLAFGIKPLEEVVRDMPPLARNTAHGAEYGKLTTLIA